MSREKLIESNYISKSTGAFQDCSTVLPSKKRWWGLLPGVGGGKVVKGLVFRRNLNRSAATILDHAKAYEIRLSQISIEGADRRLWTGNMDSSFTVGSLSSKLGKGEGQAFHWASRWKIMGPFEIE